MKLPNTEQDINERLNKIEEKLDILIKRFTGEDFHRLETKINMITDHFNIGKDNPLSPSDREKYVSNLVIKLEERRRKREAKEKALKKQTKP